MNTHARQLESFSRDATVRGMVTVLALVAASVAVAVCSCSRGDGGDGGNASITPVEHFEQTQQYTTTPHGKYVPGSARDAGPGFIQYETDDGQKWKVHYTPIKGGFHYSNAERIE